MTIHVNHGAIDRQQTDKRNKAAAINPLKTGGDGRRTEEVINTAALARAQGAQRVIPRDLGTLPLAELIKRPR
jgi:hypothetical protein